jgi:tetratricopeptide (TPR) repeat protein
MIALLCPALAGCNPGGDARMDEETEPHFVTGHNLTQQMDYEGAVDAYEKAVEANPQSAAAHWELACLYESKLNTNDPAAAIYHYQRFLKLRPDSGKAEVAQQRISTCKMELAKSVSSIASLSAATQRDLDRLMADNRDLRARLAQYEQAATNRPAVATNDVSGRGGPPVQPPARPGGGAPPAGGPAAVARTHVVKPNETLAAIARQYSIPLSALQAANPRVEARHMPVGTTLNIPAP